MTITRPRTSPRLRPPSPRRGRLGTASGRAAFLGLGPTAWYDTRDFTSTSQQTLDSRVGAGSATLGSTAGSDTNDPTIVLYDSVTHAFVPNVAGNVLSFAQSPPADGQTYVEVIARVKALSTGTFKFAGSGSTHLGVSLDGSTGKLTIYHLNTPGIVPVGNSASPSGITSFQVGTWYWVKARVTRSSALCEYWFSAESATTPVSVTWTSLGSVVGSNAGTTWLATAQGSMLVGSNTAGAGPGAAHGISYASLNWSGEVWAAWACDTGQSTNNGFTVDRSATGLTTAIVTRPLAALDGTDDYIQLPAGDTPTFTATTGTHTVLVVARNRALSASGVLWSSESASNVGANLFLTSAGVVTARVGGATTTADATVSTGQDDDVTLNVFALVYSSGTVRAYRYGSTISATTDTTGVGTVTHASAPRIGSRADSAAVLDRVEIMATAHYTRALTQAELDIASAYLTGSYV